MPALLVVAVDCERRQAKMKKSKNSLGRKTKQQRQWAGRWAGQGQGAEAQNSGTEGGAAAAAAAAF